MPRYAQSMAWARSTTQNAPLIPDSLDRAVQLRRTARKAARTALQIMAFAALAFLFFLRTPQVEGRSMLPSIAGGNHVLINTLAYGARVGPWTFKTATVKRGDIVAFARGRGDEATTYLKRVVALAGDTVLIKKGQLVVNGAYINESTFVVADRSSMNQLRIPAGSIFVLGDNRAESDDSRVLGPVSESSIIGKVLLVIWPLGDVKTIR